MTAMQTKDSVLYKAKPLRAPRDVRIMDIEPSDDFDAPISLALRVISLDSGERYQTLSYAWGSHEKSEEITCDGYPVLITANLHAALRRIREKNGQRGFTVLWADYLCIDQSNVSERNQQVALMGEIYEKCRRVVIWLGEAPEAECEKLQASAWLRDTEAERRETLMRLSWLPWFQRRWVIQEVMKPKKGVQHVLYGSTWLYFDNLLTAYKSVFSKIKDDVTFDHAPILDCQCRSGQDRLTHLHARTRLHLLDHLLIFRNALCEVEHDNIYALLSISETSFAVPVDYELDFRELSAIFALEQLKHTPVALLKCAVIMRNGASSDASMPSWVPDWRCTTHTNRRPFQKLQGVRGYLDPEQELQGLAYPARVIDLENSTDRVLIVRAHCLFDPQRLNDFKSHFKSQRPDSHSPPRLSLLDLKAHERVMVIGGGFEAAFVLHEAASANTFRLVSHFDNNIMLGIIHYNERNGNKATTEVRII